MEIPKDLEILCRHRANDSLQIILNRIKKPLKLKYYQKLIDSCHRLVHEWGDIYESFNEKGMKIIERHYLKHHNFYYFIWMAQQYYLYDKYILRQINEYMGDLFTDMNVEWQFYLMKDQRLCKKLFSWNVEEVLEILIIKDNKELFEHAMKSIPQNHDWYECNMIRSNIYFLKTYIKYNGNINKKYEYGENKTMLEYAISCRKFEHCKILLKNGAIVTDECRELIKNTDIPQEILELF